MSKFNARRNHTTHIVLMASRLGIDLGLTREQIYRKPEQWIKDKFDKLWADCTEKGFIKAR